MDVDLRALERSIEGAAAAHQRLLTHLDAAGDVDPTTPSRLPDWTIGHVLTHVARNADSFVGMFDGAERGEVVDQYPHGREGREADIEAGASRPWDQLVADVRATAWALEGTWARHTRWDGVGNTFSGRMPVADLPGRRWREVDVHHVDLGLGYETSDWPGEFVREELRRMEMLWNARQPMGMTGLPADALQAAPDVRLAWLFGRVELAGLPPAGIF